MRKQNQIRLFSFATSLALVLSVVFTSNAIADDSTPPPPTAEETTVPPTAEPVVTSTEEPVTALTEEPGITPTPEPSTEAEATISDLLSSMPENTVVVLTVDNQIVPLATQKAYNAILSGDPIWCPEGILPNPNLNGCTDSYPDLEALINDIDNSVIPEPSANGTIWIMAGADASTSDIVIDGFIFST